MHLCIMLPKKITYRRNSDETKYMSFSIKHNDFLKNIKKFGIKSARIFKKVLIVSLYTTIKI